MLAGMSLEIEQIPVLNDNYVYLLHEPSSGAAAVVDPAVPEPVLAALHRRGLRLAYILNTHHHPDHVGGNMALQQATGCTIVGPRADRDRIPGIAVELADGDVFELGAARARVYDVPGHTRGHIAYWFEVDAALFCGDTLFSLGCGRLFEGTPAQMWASLAKIPTLPEGPRSFCAHESNESNARFPLGVEPGNLDLQRRVAEIKALRAKGLPTVPSILGEERKANPFLRPFSAELQRSVGVVTGDLVAVFAETRRRKDRF